MGKFDSSTEWLRAQIKSATDALGDMRRNHEKTVIDDRDVTEERKSSYLRLIQRYTRLLTGYKRHDD
jgi:hypothetical protein